MADLLELQQSQWYHQLTFYLNGKLKTILCPNPKMTLLQYLRNEAMLSGTKLGCGEGGCGACCVMISHFDFLLNSIQHISVNACLLPLCSLDNTAVTTVEGIGSMRIGLHPVQKRISQLFGSQCGFCTPGIVMALYTQLRSFPNSSPQEIEASLDGNLCRCTGYRPILDAAKSLSNQKPCCQNSETSCSCSCAEGTNNDDCDTSRNDEKTKTKVVCSTEKILSSQLSLSAENHCEIIFPPPLMRSHPRALHFSLHGICWYQPLSLAMLLELKATYPHAKLCVGNTELGIEVKFKHRHYPVLITPCKVPQMKLLQIETSSSVSFESIIGLRVGGAVTINELRL